MEHEPVELSASPEALSALSEGITSFRVEELPGGRGDVSAVWFQADQLCLVSVDIIGLAFEFEVFTLAVKTPAEMLTIMRANAPQMEKAWAEMREAGLAIPPIGPPAEPAPAGELAQWSFRSWRLDVLKRMEFTVSRNVFRRLRTPSRSTSGAFLPSWHPLGVNRPASRLSGCYSLQMMVGASSLSPMACLAG